MIQIGAINMPEWAATVLMIAGIMFIICVVMLAAMTLKESMGDYIDRKKYEYKRKHRFDKPPLAKCYCKDCYHHCDNGRCSEHDGWYVAEDWFCWDAEPRIIDPDKEDNE